MFDIEKRLEKLEKSNRRMKITAIAATLSCIGAITIAAGSRGENGYFLNLNVSNNASVDGQTVLHEALIYDATLSSALMGDTNFVGVTNFDGATYLSNETYLASGMDLSDAFWYVQNQVTNLQMQLNECCGAVAACPSDLNDDENVGVDDLLTLIADWGDCF